MAGRVQGGLLGRWFEELSRLKYEKLKEWQQESPKGLRHKSLHVKSGVYAFWWTSNHEILRSCNRKLSLVGPGGKQVNLEIDDDWLGLSAEPQLPIPLYVGKTASGIGKRVGQHLMLGTKERILRGGGSKKAKAPTTSCQLRAGVEHLFPREKDTRALVLENIGLSYVILDGDEHAANRFYLEDMAIGLMRPALNVDIER